MLLKKKTSLILCICMLLVFSMSSAVFASDEQPVDKNIKTRSTIGCNFTMNPQVVSLGGSVTADGDASILVPFAGTYHFDMMLDRYLRQPSVVSHNNLPALNFELKHKDVWLDSDMCWSYDSGVQYIIAGYQQWINLVASAQTQTYGTHRGKWGSGSFAPDVWRTDAVSVNR